MKTKFILGAAATALATMTVQAADWSDTSLGVRAGSKFQEPFDANSISKTIISLTHASGYKYGSNFFNVDVLESGGGDPAASGGSGAQEVYVVYRNTLDLGKVTGGNFKFGAMRGLGITGGFDLNSKNDFYASKKRMFVLGPTLMLDVPGFLNVSAYLLDESNAPNATDNCSCRYHYKDHASLEADFGIPIGSLPLSFNGYAQWIASKGNNEYGGPTAAETHIDVNLMLDVGAVAGGPKHSFLLGFEYEYWRNKFGNPTTAADPGATARTPMIRGEYHF